MRRSIVVDAPETHHYIYSTTMTLQMLQQADTVIYDENACPTMLFLLRHNVARYSVSFHILQKPFRSFCAFSFSLSQLLFLLSLYIRFFILSLSLLHSSPFYSLSLSLSCTFSFSSISILLFRFKFVSIAINCHVPQTSRYIQMRRNYQGQTTSLSKICQR